MCGPKFCSMRISHDIRDAARQQGESDKGMAAMAARYREGGDLYMPVQDAGAGSNDTSSR
jgi:phosphomethylpyrimidine synthase